MKNFSISKIQGITYSNKQLWEFRDSVIRNLSYNIGFFTGIVIQLREINFGVMVLELSYPPKTIIEKDIYRMIIQRLFADVNAPNFWEIKLLNVVHYHTSGEGGYIGMCGNIMYRDPDYDPRSYPDDPGFDRYRVHERFYDTHQIYSVLNGRYGYSKN